jgi:hypothetical protein
MENYPQVKCFAFTKINNHPKGLEDVIDTSLSIENESYGYEEIGVIIERELEVDAREDSAIKMLTFNIVQTFKKCKNDYIFQLSFNYGNELNDIRIFIDEFIEYPNIKQLFDHFIDNSITDEYLLNVKDTINLLCKYLSLLFFYFYHILLFFLLTFRSKSLLQNNNYF